MFKTVVYDDGRRSEVIEEFTDEKELVVVRKAIHTVRHLRECGKEALGRFTFVLTKEGV